MTFSICEKNKSFYEGGDFVNSNENFNIGKLKIRIGETRLHLTYGQDAWNFDIKYSTIMKAVKNIVEKLQAKDVTV